MRLSQAMLIVLGGLVITACSNLTFGTTPSSNAPTEPLPPVIGPALGHVPVPRETDYWDASESDPEATAKAFVLGPNLKCDCDAISTTLIPGESTEIVIVKLSMQGVKDDSVRDVEYLIEMHRSSGAWSAKSATYLVGCHRGIDQKNGRCV